MERRGKLRTKDEDRRFNRRRGKAKCLTRNSEDVRDMQGRMRLLICKEETIR